ncbi:MAG: hypothetical protein IPP13_03235 [Kouleothrix sp.]|nr:hypothetical protein [Kouleothrix sp.]
MTLNVRNQAPIDVLTDNNGVARVFIDIDYAGQPGEMRVEAAGFKTYVQNIDIVAESLPDDVQLEPVGASILPTSSSSNSQTATQVSTDVPAVKTPTVSAPATPSQAASAMPEVSPTSTEPTSAPSIIAINKEIKSSVDGVTLDLDNIEPGQDGQSKWHFTYKNATNNRVCLFVVKETTYVSEDANLNKYPILDTDLEDTWVDPLTKLSFWFEFDAPLKASSNQFSVIIMTQYPFGWLGCNPTFKSFKVNVPKNEPVQQPTSHPTSTEPTSAPSIIAINKEIKSSVDGVTLDLDNIEPGQDGQSKWHFTYKNATNNRVCLFVVKETTYVSEDANLNKYPILDTDLEDTWVDPLTKLSFWFEFDAPLKASSNQFSVIVTTQYPFGWLGCNPTFKSFKITVPHK